MLVYKFDKGGFFCGEVEVSGRGIPPFHAFEKPPKAASGEVAKMTPSGWVLVEDARKQVATSTLTSVAVSFEPSITPEEVREERNSLLEATDWVVIKAYETGTNIPAEWEIYRQALRDITDHQNFPNLSTDDWPVKP